MTTYLSKAEEIINEGLKVVRIRDGLWIESSNIQKFLGYDESHLRALQRAVEDSPSTVVARYLLGRTHRRRSEYQIALDTLQPIIMNHPDQASVLCRIFHFNDLSRKAVF